MVGGAAGGSVLANGDVSKNLLQGFVTPEEIVVDVLYFFIGCWGMICGFLTNYAQEFGQVKALEGCFSHILFSPFHHSSFFSVLHKFSL